MPRAPQGPPACPAALCLHGSAGWRCRLWGAHHGPLESAGGCFGWIRSNLFFKPREFRAISQVGLRTGPKNHGVPDLWWGGFPGTIISTCAFSQHHVVLLWELLWAQKVRKDPQDNLLAQLSHVYLTVPKQGGCLTSGRKCNIKPFEIK